MQITIDFEEYSQQELSVMRERLDNITFSEFISGVYLTPNVLELVEPDEDDRDILVTYRKVK